MDAGFVFQIAKNFLTGDFENDFLESADFGRAAFEMLAFPPAEVGVALIHAHQFGGEKRGFVTTGPGADFDERVAVLVGIGGEQGVLELGGKGGDFRFESGDFLGGHGGELRVVGFGEFLIVSEMALGGLEFFPEREGLLELAVLAKNFRGALGIREKFGIADGFLQLRESVAAFGNER